MRCLPLLGALLLSACATAKPEPRIITREIKVPIPVACVPEIQPAGPYAADAIPLDADIFALVKALLIEREQRKIAELNLRSALEGCR